MRICVIIPHYDHVEQFTSMLDKLVSADLPLIIVDDASPKSTFRQLEEVLGREAPGALLLRHSKNQGKGGAVMTGLRAAYDAGYSHALQVDADGQHDTADIPRFVSLATRHPEALICGKPVFDASISRLRYYARYITLFLSWLESLDTAIEDAMCGFRLYPLSRVVPVFERSRTGKRMAFDPEILVRCVWDGIELRYLPVEVKYPQGGRSHFHYIGDNLEISWMHTRLIIGMLIRLPRLLTRSALDRSRRTTE
jgi:glycosyltransferase involved in cell wall biosynthesis